MDPFEIISPNSARVPIILSIPHCGTEFPEFIKQYFKPDKATEPDDTDWYLDKLYDFAKDMGITTIKARYSRWVIDLNRDPKDEALYDDGRLTTALTPTTTFSGVEIYRYDPPDQDEIDQRLHLYYYPYHNKLKELIADLKYEFENVLLFDAHSIKQKVPAIHPDNFPNLILGDNKRMSAGPDVIQAAVKSLSSSEYSFAHNFLFKGGYITRHFGNPKQGVHALQLEMTMINYMNQWEINYDEEKAEKMKLTLKNLFSELIDVLAQPS